MNFFQRRKILKKINFLDLVPVRVHEHSVNENGKIDILVPRFTNVYFKRALQTRKKGDYFIIHLDEKGSLIWNMIDGIRNTEEIASILQKEHEEKFQPVDETQTRVTNFLSLLYQERYITFRQIMD